MTTWTQTSSGPFARLSLYAKGGQSPSPRTREPSKRTTGDDDYIPYNGPYEEPPRRRQRSRDSWGDPLYDEDGNNMIQEVHQRYVPNQPEYPWHDEDEERNGRPRARTYSAVSGRTVSSGTVDPHRASLLRKGSHHANVARPPVPSYINLDAAGGVGESPAPPTRVSREVAPPKRGSLASIFTFGQTSKRLPLSPAKIALPTSPPPQRPVSNAKYVRAYTQQPEQPPSGPPSIYSVSSDHHKSSLYSSHEGDAYHSYYNYTPAADQFGHLSDPRNATPPPHPYAYNLPQRDFPDPPQTAPLLTSPKLKFTAPQPPRFALPQQQQQQQQQEPPSAITTRVRSLKNFASTPNLREASNSPNRLRKPLSPGLPKGKDRWLSAETWCDAVMFPRPRLKAEDAKLVLRGASGRIVSPPSSPVFGGFNAPQNPDRPEGVVSRVLAHSRSMVSLNNPEAGPSRLKHKVSFNAIQREPVPVTVAPPPPPIIVAPPTERPPRPKSFAWDDLALPSPVPSLARVLEEGQILEHQRKKWQMQATGSFQNTRARSVSRSRAKSLTQKGAKKPAAGQSTMDYLAARSLLGNQNAVPVLPARLHKRSNSQGGNTNGTSTFNTRTSHSHSNSLVKTPSKSSLSQGHTHSRHDSWSRTAFKKAAAICYVDGALSPADEHSDGLENALRTGGTKVIRLADPALITVDMSGPLSALSPRNGVSPVPSAGSDALMGIAISTPPPNDNASAERDSNSIHLPSHPYAQGGLLSYHDTAPVTRATTSAAKQGADYAGPHPTAAIANPDPTDFSARHRLPPQASLTYHPYATPSRRDSYQIVPHANSDVPPQSKMWAQLSPGIVREILPGELLYSPFMSERSSTPEEERERERERDVDGYGHMMRNRKSTVTILDTVGLGETLAYAVEEENNRDSGHGTSEEQPTNAALEWVDDGQAEAEAADVAGHHPYRIHRKPVQYDIGRPPYTPKKSGVSSGNTKSGISSYTNHTVASSAFDPTSENEHGLTPPFAPQPASASPILDSAASSPPRSPPAIGSVDDLDEFRDLFYKPNLTDEMLNNLSRPPSTRQSGITWDFASTTRTQRTRTGSGLTSLARQLSAEFEELRATRRSGSLDSESSISRFSRFPTESDIRFVFSNSDMSRSVLEEPVRAESPEEALPAFHPSNHLPEDVESSRASSPIDGPADEEDEPFRFGSVGSVVTPAAESTDHRTSYTGQMAFVNAPETEPPVPKDGIPIPRAVSNLQPHSADPTRSSYMTESTVSRMSNLSDFPAPPPQHMTPAHMSLLSSYFHETAGAERTVREDESVVTFGPRIGERF
ncbi:hypothetical protein C8F04DRAFT_941738 [Mycena alexandri]|uniref:Uncharacterized protein n=1 Tax=Mycena alexandri TaxID=1745969 RepID=A0AAD6XGL1_9AGAR|nr:hypothetical protein C8F04DRAFT_941738 [Mycena alexandri]